MQTWQMQEAKARMSELVKRAQTQPQDSLVDFMRRSPLYGADDIAFERDQSLTREVAF